jgi:hypothetical protein
MKKLQWVMVGILFLNLSCLLLISASGLTHFVNSQQFPRKYENGELIASTVMCSLIPATVALCTMLVWSLGWRIEAEERRNCSISKRPVDKLLLEEATATLLQHGKIVEYDHSHLYDGLRARFRQFLPDLESLEKARILLVLHRLGFLSGPEPLSLYGIDFCAVDLRFANLRGAILTGINLRQALLAGADLRDCDLRGANLSSADLRLALLDDAKLDNAILQSALLHQASLRNTRLRGAVLTDANFWQADLEGVQLSARWKTILTPDSTADSNSVLYRGTQRSSDSNADSENID